MWLTVIATKQARAPTARMALSTALGACFLRFAWFVQRDEIGCVKGSWNKLGQSPVFFMPRKPLDETDPSLLLSQCWEWGN